MATSPVLTTNIDYAVKDFYSKDLLMTVSYMFVYGKFGTKATVPAGHKNFEWRRWPNLTVKADPGAAWGTDQSTDGYKLSEGVTPQYSLAMSVEKVTATPDQLGAYIEGSDLVKTTVIDPIMTITNKKLGQHSGESIDTINLNVLAADTGTDVYAGASTTDNTVTPGDWVSYDELVEVVRTHKGNKVSPVQNGKWAMTIGPSGWATLIKDRDFKDAVQYGNRDAMFTGKLGTFVGIDFYETPVVKTVAGTLTTVHYSFCFGDEAYGILSWAGMGLESIFTPPGGLEDPLRQRWKMAWKASHKCVVLNPLFFITLHHAVNVG